MDELVAMISRAVSHGISEHFGAATASKATRAPETKPGVPAARERVSAELGFIGYVENIYRATLGGGHAE